MRSSPLSTNKVYNIGITTLLTAIVSTSPFTAVYSNITTFQPQFLRTVFLLCIAFSWPFLLASTATSLYVFLTLRREQPQPRYVFATDALALQNVLWSTLVAVLAYVLLIVAQAIWIYAAARVGIIWLLSLVVLGMAVLVVFAAMMLGVASHVMRLQADTAMQSSRKVSSMRAATDQPAVSTTGPGEVVLRLDKDDSSPQNIVATIPKHDSRLDF